jgi:hypothetical protein
VRDDDLPGPLDSATDADVVAIDGRSPGLHLRIPPDLLAAIDEARGTTGRAQWVRDAAVMRLGAFARGELAPLVAALVQATGDLGRVGGLLKILVETRGAPRAEILTAIDQLAVERDRMAILRDHIIERVGRRRRP